MHEHTAKESLFRVSIYSLETFLEYQKRNSAVHLHGPKQINFGIFGLSIFKLKAMLWILKVVWGLSFNERQTAGRAKIINFSWTFSLSRKALTKVLAWSETKVASSYTKKILDEISQRWFMFSMNLNIRFVSNLGLFISGSARLLKCYSSMMIL